MWCRPMNGVRWGCAAKIADAPPAPAAVSDGESAMSTALMDRVARHVRAAALGRGGEGPSDGELLECFVRQRDELAFAALVRRHGPMVLGLCRRVVGNPHDAEDAFQATFLVLVRRAASLGAPELVGNWLYGVAYRTARKARVVS